MIKVLFICQSNIHDNANEQASQANGGRQKPLSKQWSGPFGQMLHPHTLSKMICLRR